MSQWYIHSTSEVIQLIPPRHAIIIDTDIGDDIDDALALAVALTTPDIELVGVTTVFGDTHRRAHLAAHLLQIFGHEDVPVAAGVGTPILPRGRPSRVPQAAVIDENVHYPAMSTLSGPEFIIQAALARPGDITLLCIGPQTNIALALVREPRLATAIRQIIFMGGTSSIPLAEWNIRNDARAAQIVLESGIPLTMIGLDITLRCQLRDADLALLQTHPTPELHLLNQLITLWRQHKPRWHPAQPYLHDPLTIAALCVPELFQLQQIPVHLVTHGMFTGYIIPRFAHGPLVHAVTAVNVERVRNWIVEHLLASARATPASSPVSSNEAANLGDNVG